MSSRQSPIELDPNARPHGVPGKVWPGVRLSPGRRCDVRVTHDSCDCDRRIPQAEVDTELDQDVDLGVSEGFSREANQLDAQLPTPKGTLLISVSGGANNVTMVAPAHSQWRVAVSGGVSAVTINGSSSGNLGGDFQQQSQGYGSATDRFDIEISGGASHIDFRTG